MSKNIFWIDTHAHLTSKTLVADWDMILERAWRANVQEIVNICTDQASLQSALAMPPNTVKIHHTAAVTPHDVQNIGDSFFAEVTIAAHQKQLLAIGETGLDYFYEHSPKKLQIAFFEKHLALASELNLPVIIHCRDAFSDLLAILAANFSSAKVLIHCFTGSYQEAKACLEKGYMISMSGIVTFAKSTDLQKTFAALPLESLLMETDSPYLAPVPYRGKTNEPAFIVETAKFLAHLQQIDLADLALKLQSNFRTFFNL